MGKTKRIQRFTFIVNSRKYYTFLHYLEPFIIAKHSYGRLCESDLTTLLHFIGVTSWSWIYLIVDLKISLHFLIFMLVFMIMMRFNNMLPIFPIAHSPSVPNTSVFQQETHEQSKKPVYLDESGFTETYFRRYAYASIRCPC